jgi:hypothetical protein
VCRERPGGKALVGAARCWTTHCQCASRRSKGEFLADLPYPTLLNEWSRLEREGLRMDDIEAYEVDGRRVWSVIMTPGTGDVAALVDYDWDSFRAAWGDLERRVFLMHDHEVDCVDGRRLYTGILRPGAYSPGAHLGRPLEDFGPVWADMQAGGGYLQDLATYRLNGSLRYTGTCAPAPAPAHSHTLRWRLTSGPVHFGFPRFSRPRSWGPTLTLTLHPPSRPGGATGW